MKFRSHQDRQNDIQPEVWISLRWTNLSEIFYRPNDNTEEIEIMAQRNVKYVL